MVASSLTPTASDDGPAKPARRPWRRRIRRFLVSLLVVILVLYLIVWWVSLRIIENPSWPPPADAVAPAQAQAVTEAFARKGDARRDDVDIAYAPTTAANPQLYLDGTEFFPAMLEDIANARNSIHMQMFGMTPGYIPQQFVDALSARAEEGVEVRLIVDGYGAKVNEQSEPLFDQLRESGVEVVVNHEFPLDRDGLLGSQAIDWRQDEVGQADHRKTMVVDGIVGWVGGGGLEDHFNGGSFHDVFVRVEGNIVLQMQAVFLTSFHAFGGPVASGEGDLAAYFPEQRDPGTIRVTLLQNIPGGFVAGTQASRQIIRNATTRLDVMNPYFTDPGIIDLIVDAANRGVHVRLLVSERSNNAPADAALKHQYGRMLDAGIEIWEYPATMHAKVTVADDDVIIGTINYDAWALYRNLEIALLFEDAAVADTTVQQFIEPDIAQSRPGEEPTGFGNRFRGWFWDKFTYFL
jgi:cardiolipin synthase